MRLGRLKGLPPMPGPQGFFFLVTRIFFSLVHTVHLQFMVQSRAHTQTKKNHFITTDFIFFRCQHTTDVLWSVNLFFFTNRCRSFKLKYTGPMRATAHNTSVSLFLFCKKSRIAWTYYWRSNKNKNQRQPKHKNDIK